MFIFNKSRGDKSNRYDPFHGNATEYSIGRLIRVTEMKGDGRRWKKMEGDGKRWKEMKEDGRRCKKMK